MHTLSAIELRDKFVRGDLSARAITEHFLQRIKAYDGEIGAFLSVFEERALQKADHLDEKKKRCEKLGRLAGIPIALKDNIHVKGTITTCASKFLVNYVAPFDATVTRLIEEEDGVIIGKTNMDEFAMGSSSENSALQATHNPWNLKCVPGGSSGGSAAAVAARLCPIALGSDTGGSIRLPAAFTGIIGYKPTYGRVSRYGLVAYGSSFDQIGPFATNVEDAALMMEILGKHCDKDATSIQNDLGDIPLNKQMPISRVGVPMHTLSSLAPESKAAFETGLKRLGSEIVPIELPMIRYSIPVYYILAGAEASTNLARFDGIRYGVRSKDAKTLKEVYSLSKEEGFGPEVKRRILIGTYVLSAGYQDAYYKKAQKVRTLMINEFENAFSHCDAIAMPVSPFAAFEAGSIKDPVQMYLEDIYTILSNLVGCPSISVPNGFTKSGMPLGFQLLTRQQEDKKLLQIAHAFHETCSIPPRYQ